MKSTIRNIGNLKVTIMSQNILEKCQIEHEINIEVRDKIIVISLVEEQTRKDWPEASQEIAKNGDDELIIPDLFEDKDLINWTWK